MTKDQVVLVVEVQVTLAVVLLEVVSRVVLDSELHTELDMALFAGFVLAVSDEDMVYCFLVASVVGHQLVPMVHFGAVAQVAAGAGQVVHRMDLTFGQGEVHIGWDTVEGNLAVAALGILVEVVHTDSTYYKAIVEPHYFFRRHSLKQTLLVPRCLDSMKGQINHFQIRSVQQPVSLTGTLLAYCLPSNIGTTDNLITNLAHCLFSLTTEAKNTLPRLS